VTEENASKRRTACHSITPESVQYFIMNDSSHSKFLNVLGCNVSPLSSLVLSKPKAENLNLPHSIKVDKFLWFSTGRKTRLGSFATRELENRSLLPIEKRSLQGLLNIREAVRFHHVENCCISAGMQFKQNSLFRQVVTLSDRYA